MSVICITCGQSMLKNQDGEVSQCYYCIKTLHALIKVIKQNKHVIENQHQAANDSERKCNVTK